MRVRFVRRVLASRSIFPPYCASHSASTRFTNASACACPARRPAQRARSPRRAAAVRRWLVKRGWSKRTGVVKSGPGARLEEEGAAVEVREAGVDPEGVLAEGQLHARCHVRRQGGRDGEREREIVKSKGQRHVQREGEGDCKVKRSRSRPASCPGDIPPPLPLPSALRQGARLRVVPESGGPDGGVQQRGLAHKGREQRADVAGGVARRHLRAPPRRARGEGRGVST